MANRVHARSCMCVQWLTAELFLFVRRDAILSAFLRDKRNIAPYRREHHA